MNTSQIKYALEQHPITHQKFCGVFAADKIPKSMDTYPCGFVANTDPSTKPGTHWVALFFMSKDNGEFFYSYGQPPQHYRDLFKPYFGNYKLNTQKLQSPWSDVCGQYCIFYLYHRCLGFSMNKIVNMFTKNTEWNDCQVACYVREHFNVVTVNRPECIVIQCCKSSIDE